MSTNKKKNIALTIATGILLLALFDGWEYGFFTVLRFVLFATTAYVAWMVMEQSKEKWAWFLGLIAILFNPFIPVYLERETWVVIDFAVALLLVGTIFRLKLDKAPN